MAVSLTAAVAAGEVERQRPAEDQPLRERLLAVGEIVILLCPTLHSY